MAKKYLKRFTLSDTTQRRFWENLRNLWDISEETSLINIPGDVSEICKSALFEMSLRRCIRRLKDASEMHPYRLNKDILWKSDNPISLIIEPWKHAGLLVISKSMQHELAGFLKQVFPLIIFLQLQTWQKSSTDCSLVSEFRSPRRIKLSYFEE